MATPGMDLLGLALTAIESQEVRYFKFTGAVTSPSGRDVSSFADGVDIEDGSLQSVARDRYQRLGLDEAKQYVSWFVELDAHGVSRLHAGDDIEYDGRRYKLTSETRWMTQDGWTWVIGVDIGEATS